MRSGKKVEIVSSLIPKYSYWTLITRQRNVKYLLCMCAALLKLCVQKCGWCRNRESKSFLHVLPDRLSSNATKTFATDRWWVYSGWCKLHGEFILGLLVPVFTDSIVVFLKVPGENNLLSDLKTHSISSSLQCIDWKINSAKRCFWYSDYNS